MSDQELETTKDILVNVIKDLPERDRTILSLYYYEDLNYKEIAQILNITVSHVAELHSKIIRILKKSLDINP